MIRKIPLAALSLVLLLVLTLLAAGCLSVPGPEDAKKTPVVTTVQTASATERMSTVQTPVVKRTPSSSATTSVPAITPTGAAAGVSGSCIQQGGTEVHAGYQCTGTWLTASDTFSCCSSVPVREAAATGGNESVTAIPSAFSLSVNLDDSLGSITP